MSSYELSSEVKREVMGKKQYSATHAHPPGLTIHHRVSQASKVVPRVQDRVRYCRALCTSFIDAASNRKQGRLTYNHTNTATIETPFPHTKSSTKTINTQHNAKTRQPCKHV